MKKIYFLFTSGRKERLEEVRGKKAPSEFFYGGPELEQRGYEVRYLEYEDFNYSDKPPSSLLGKLINRLFAPKKLAEALALPKNLALLNSSDILVATTNRYGSALAKLRLRQVLTARVAFLPMGFLDLNADAATRLAAKETLEQVLALVISKNETAYLQTEFPDLKKNIAYLPFGVDTAYWQPAKNQASTPYVLSIGNDRNRDYESLVAAWKESYPELRIITKRTIAAKLPGNVKIFAGDWRGQLFSDDQIRSLMQEALFGIIPLINTIQPAGQSACLQMMACGKTVILSNIDGLWDPAVMQNGKTCLLPRPGSVPDLQRDIELLLSNPARLAEIGASAHSAVSEYFTTTIMADRFAELIDTL